MERSAVVSGSQLPIRLARLRTRLVRHDENERVEPGVVGLDALQALLGQLTRAHLAGAEHAAECVNSRGRGRGRGRGRRRRGDRGHRVDRGRPSARSLKSAARSAAVERASDSRSGLSSGSPLAVRVGQRPFEPGGDTHM